MTPYLKCPMGEGWFRGDLEFRVSDLGFRISRSRFWFLALGMIKSGFGKYVDLAVGIWGSMAEGCIGVGRSVRMGLGA